MNSDSQFEQRLRERAIKPVPGEWRADILRAASHAAAKRTAASVTPVSSLEMLKSRLATWLWPAPRAWAALATVWVMILLMNLSGGRESTTAPTEIPAAQTRMALKQKQLLMAELAGRTETRETVQPRATAPGPRSQRREETSAV